MLIYLVVSVALLCVTPGQPSPLALLPHQLSRYLFTGFFVFATSYASKSVAVADEEQPYDHGPLGFLAMENSFVASKGRPMTGITGMVNREALDWASARPAAKTAAIAHTRTVRLINNISFSSLRITGKAPRFVPAFYDGTGRRTSAKPVIGIALLARSKVT